jgi:hypothetical protein
MKEMMIWINVVQLFEEFLNWIQSFKYFKICFNSNLIIFKGSNMWIQWIFTFLSILNLFISTVTRLKNLKAHLWDLEKHLFNLVRISSNFEMIDKWDNA